MYKCLHMTLVLIVKIAGDDVVIVQEKVHCSRQNEPTSL